MVAIRRLGEVRMVQTFRYGRFCIRPVFETPDGALNQIFGPPGAMDGWMGRIFSTLALRPETDCVHLQIIAFEAVREIKDFALALQGSNNVGRVGAVD